ncbi:subtilisin inhibitor-like [Nocardia tenerifensis]|uniref:Subtilisin inhibitor-like n=1 Tax=Nocardia tenerifensis TaxID=228006 RepID=A0A318K8N1_9NOCA|nr:SSI family serine proteinase inhibitor [Nocardia tenerifensis]PXX69074.1 subtilisin inhibitor-like [Nocardia tenerifensis]
MSCTGRIAGLSVGAAVALGLALAAPVEAAPPPVKNPPGKGATGDDEQSVVTLSVGPGVSVEVVDRRVVSLICSPEIGGTHPKPEEACANLANADGNIRALADYTVPPLCSQDFEPVVATIDGVWRGKPVSDHGFFSNVCVLRATTVSVFDF